VSETSGQEISDRTRWRAFAVAVFVAALTILDLSKVNVGLPSIERSLDAGSSELQLIVAGYALAFGLALVPAGRLGDIYGRKILFVIGLSAFTLSSVACALAPNEHVLVVFRILQGVAAGIQMPQVLGLIQQLFQGEARGRAFGLFGAVIGFSTAFGPTLGGLLILLGGEQDGWRLLFWMNVPLGLAAIFFAVRLLPAQTGPRVRTEIDLIGVLILAVTTFSLLFPFLLTTGSPSDDNRRWLLLIVTAVGAALFFWWERRYRARGKSPVVHFELFRHASYRNGVLVATAYFAALPATFLMTTLYLQEGLKLEPVFAGLVGVPFALTSAVSALLGGRVVNKYGRGLVVVGLAVVIAGFILDVVLAVVLSPEWAPWGMAAALFVAGIGGGLVVSPNQTLTLAQVPVEQGGVAGSMAQLGQRVGTAIGTSIATSVFFAAIANGGGDLSAYHTGFRNGVLIAVALIVVALALAVVDLMSRRKRGTPTV
jgi:EmrB/QacA subfamily drug resistance transporter